MSARKRIRLGRGATQAPLVFTVPADTTVRLLGSIIAGKLGLATASAEVGLAGDAVMVLDPDELVADVVTDSDVVVALPASGGAGGGGASNKNPPPGLALPQALPDAPPPPPVHAHATAAVVTLFVGDGRKLTLPPMRASTATLSDLLSVAELELNCSADYAVALYTDTQALCRGAGSDADMQTTLADAGIGPGNITLHAVIFTPADVKGTRAGDDAASAAAAASAARGGGGGGGATDTGGDGMQIFLRYIAESGFKTVTVNGVKPTDTVEVLRVKVFTKTGVPVDAQRLVYNCKTLMNGQTLGCYGVSKESTLALEIQHPHSLRRQANDAFGACESWIPVAAVTGQPRPSNKALATFLVALSVARDKLCSSDTKRQHFLLSFAELVPFRYVRARTCVILRACVKELGSAARFIVWVACARVQVTLLPPR